MIVFFDTETTGLPLNWNAPITDSDNWPRLVEIAWLIYDYNGQKKSEKSYIIKPEDFDIPENATKVHGISTAKAHGLGIELIKVLKEFIADILYADYIVAHNMNFDEKVVGAEFNRKSLRNILDGKKKICTMLETVDYCAIPAYSGYKWPKLSELYQKLFGTNFDEAHNADVDILATAKCFWELLTMGVIKLNAVNYSISENFIGDYQIIGTFNGGKYGVIDKDGFLVILPTYDFINAISEGLALVVENGKTGYIDFYGKKIIQCCYESGEIFTDGYAIVSTKVIHFIESSDGDMDYDIKEIGLIDKNGNVVVPCIYDSYNILKNKIICFHSGESVVYFDKANRQISAQNVQPKQTSKYEEFHIKEQALIPYRIGTLYGYCNEDKIMVIPAIYVDALPFNDGIARIAIQDKNSYQWKYGVIDIKGNEVVRCSYNDILEFSEGLAAVSKDGKWGYIDIYGKITTPLVYEKCTHFSEGLAAVSNGDKWGFIDIYGNTSLPFVYDGIYRLIELNYEQEYYSVDIIFSEGLAAVSMYNKIGYIDKFGNNIIPFIYDVANPFSENVATVAQNTSRHNYLSWTFISKNGEQISSKKYLCHRNRHIFKFENGILSLDKGYINLMSIEFWEEVSPNNDALSLPF